MSFRRNGPENPHFSASCLHDYPDPAQEAECDELVNLAALLCGTQAALLTLLGERRRWYRTSLDYKFQDTPREIAFCAYAVRQTRLFVVHDATDDKRFLSNPLLSGEPAIRFFAGTPMFDSDGQALGVLCVIDSIPRTLTHDQEYALEVLGRQAAALLTLRLHHKALEETLKEKERITAGLRANEQLFRAFMNASPFLSYIKDPAGRLLFYNKTFAEHFGVGEFAWVGRADDRLWSAVGMETGVNHDSEVLTAGRLVKTEECLRSTDGSITTWKSYKFPCVDSAGNVLLAGVAVDISEESARKDALERSCLGLEQANEQLRRVAVTDELTGLSNRRAFEERLAAEFSMARRRRRELAVLLLDIDNFKDINDRLGHSNGDDVLRKMAFLLKTTIRLPDLPARYGGEEFVILLPESGNEGALGLARRLLDRVKKEPWGSGALTISIGMAVMNESMISGLEMIILADEALHAAKRSGKNRALLHGL